MTRRFLSGRGFVVALLLAPALAASVALPAVAADPVGTSPAGIDHLDFSTPRTPWDYKTTVPGSVIRDAAKGSTRGPAAGYSDPTRAAQIASSTRQTKGAQQLTSTKGPSVKDWLNKPGAVTPAQQKVITETTNSARIPSTSMGRLVKGANAAGAVMLGAELGFAAGKGVSGMMGLDPDGGLCQPDFNDFGMIGFVTGADCSKVNQLDPAYVPNTDATGGGLGMARTCSSDPSEGCFEWVANDGQFSCFNLFGYDAQKNSSTHANIVISFYKNGSSGQQEINPSGGFPMGKDNQWGCVPTNGAPYRISTITFAGELTGAQWKRDYDAGKPMAKIEQGSTDPSRMLRCTVTGNNGATAVGWSDPYTEGGGAVSLPSCGMLPDGIVPSKYTVDLVPSNAKEIAGEKVGDWDATPAYQKLATETPECLTSLCTAELFKVNGTELASCFDTPGPCIDWFESPSKVKDFQCHYAGKVVDLSECNHYAPTFDPEKLAKGQAYADPTTGKAGAPGSSPSTQPGGTAISPGNPEPSGACFPTGWGVINPMNWVLQPVGCALREAFLPSPGKVAGAQARVAKNVDASGLGTLVRNTTQLGVIPIPGNGCGGIPLKFDLGGRFGVNVDTHILQACPGDTLAPVAATTKTILTGLVVTAGFLAMLRYVATIFGFSGLGGIQSEFRMSDKRAEAAAREAAK